jgi:hypothetical protein
MNSYGNGILLRNQDGNWIGVVLLKSQAESRYRLELAKGFLAEALQDVELFDWKIRPLKLDQTSCKILKIPDERLYYRLN